VITALQLQQQQQEEGHYLSDTLYMYSAKGTLFMGHSKRETTYGTPCLCIQDTTCIFVAFFVEPIEL
jgi:hypothetical protein